ncbi:MAG: DUF72 domain-containing protein [Methylobacter sp.]|uniref:DUF72 domain-containing protein n=1 Tax=Methylobacter sp. TaxID=2051955 RepID=UPI002731FB2A|nr:DUF72 domain-containing protein [Methylobacter sp.]MDP1666321.1 DUF72 domain-containing protein [Methylobacter sp.]
MISIGTSGWGYPDWQQHFYTGVARKDWLRFYAERFSAVEINGTFYRLQSLDTFKKWFDETPATFRFALKANRYLTHNKKLRDPLPSVLIEKSHAEALGEKLAVVLWQLPGLFQKDLARLRDFIDALQQWPEVRHNIEFRHASWFDDETADCLSKAEVAVCISDAQSWPMWDHVTSNLVYIRLHGHAQTYVSAYSQPELAYWAERIDRWLQQDKEVHVYFDNTAECAAPFNALALQTLVESYKK